MSENSTKPEEKEPKPSKPNELGYLYISTHLKIHDPNTKEVFVQKRGDS